MIPTTLDTLLDQLRIVRILLSRLLVQQQIGALLAVLLVTWLLGWGLQRLTMLSLTNRAPRLRSLPYLYWPLLALGVGWISAEAIFAQRLVALDLYTSLLNLIWLLLAYRLCVAVVYQLGKETQAKRYHRWLLTPVFLLIIAVVMVRLILGSLRATQAIPLATIGTYTLTVGTIVTLLLVIYITVIVSWILQDVLYHFVAPRMSADAGIVHSISMIGRYSVIALGILVGLRALGLDLSNFAIIGGGLSVGIGFGMQQIVANFFAGIMLLFEQALRPGDVIKLEEEVGVVEKLNIRSTVVRTYDNVEVVVPNERFLTSKLTSYTKSDRTVRLSLSVGAGYDSDPEQVRDLLLAAGRAQTDVLEEPAPTVFFKGFGDSSIDFDLLVWLTDPRIMPRVRSDLYFEIWKQFAVHDIEIPFPQRDLNLRRGWEQVGLPTQD